MWYRHIAKCREWTIGFVINFFLYSWYLLLAHLSWKFKLAFLITWCPASVCMSVCKLFTFDLFSRIASFPKGRWLWNSENILRKFKNLLLQKRWANFDKTWHNTSLCEGDSRYYRSGPFNMQVLSSDIFAIIYPFCIISKLDWYWNKLKNVNVMNVCSYEPIWI